MRSPNSPQAQHIPREWARMFEGSTKAALDIITHVKNGRPDSDSRDGHRRRAQCRDLVHEGISKACCDFRTYTVAEMETLVLRENLFHVAVTVVSPERVPELEDLRQKGRLNKGLDRVATMKPPEAARVSDTQFGLGLYC